MPVMDAVELTALVNTVANLLSVNMCPKELALAAALFTQLGDTLAAIAVVRANDAENSEENKV